MRKFRVLQGYHNENGETYGPGDVLYSASDLLKHNTRIKQPKFELVEEDTHGLEEMTVGELRRLAENEKIDLGDARRKGDIVEILKSVLCD